MYYGVNSPYAYGGGAYGGVPYGTYGSSAGDIDGETVVGSLSFGRILRVISQRWLSIFVFLLIGFIISFAVYRISPTIYEAKSEFSMDMRRNTSNQNIINQVMPDYGSTYVEIFNTRLSDWRSEKIVTKILQEYRSDHPSSTISDEEIMTVLSGSVLELVKNSRIITITTRSKVPALAASLANAYAEAIENFTDEENKFRCDKAVSQIHLNVEKQRREVQKLASELRDFRTANKVDNLRSIRDTLKQSLQSITTEILAFEGKEAQLVEWEKLLQKVKKEPENFGTLSSGVPLAQEIAEEFRAFQDASGEYSKLIVGFTEQHPSVIEKKKEQDLARERFLAATDRALKSGQSTLTTIRNQLANGRVKQSNIRDELSSCEQKIVLAESGLAILENNFGVANRVLEGLILDENKARLDAEGNNEIVRVGRPASVPSKPVLPNPILIFSVGIFLSIFAGIFFVLILDNLEDTIVNLSDIEQRLALKVLAVLPHIKKKKRVQVAKYVLEDKYSQFAETVASLRNLLDSPRYESVSKSLILISTQPAEGKTITSTSLAISYAMSGKKTLHVDFDLRRPRLAKIWDLADIDKSQSFSHNLQSFCDSGKRVDFDAIVQKTQVDNLDALVSLSPNGVSPATILGSHVIGEFFEWARSRYDHVIVDSPPFGVVGDVVTLSMAVDSVIVMCCPDKTHFGPVQFCTRTLIEAGANIIGAVVNDVAVADVRAFSQTRGGYGYKYKYNYSSRYAPQDIKEDGNAEIEHVTDDELTDDE
jgi:capsular exopolysaccharide synthesis family protein